MGKMKLSEKQNAAKAVIKDLVLEGLKDIEIIQTDTSKYAVLAGNFDGDDVYVEIALVAKKIGYDAGEAEAEYLDKVEAAEKRAADLAAKKAAKESKKAKKETE